MRAARSSAVALRGRRSARLRASSCRRRRGASAARASPAAPRATRTPARSGPAARPRCPRRARSTAAAVHRSRSARSRMPERPKCPSRPARRYQRVDPDAVVPNQQAHVALGAYSSSTSTAGALARAGTRSRAPRGRSGRRSSRTEGWSARGVPSTITRSSADAPSGHLLAHSREGLRQVEACRARRSAARAPCCALLDHLRDQLLHAPEQRAGRRALGHLPDGHVQLHRRAHEALQQGVVQLARDAGPLREALFEERVEPPRHLAEAPGVERASADGRHGQDARRAWNHARLPERPARSLNASDRFRAVPQPVAARRRRRGTRTGPGARLA